MCVYIIIRIVFIHVKLQTRLLNIVIIFSCTDVFGLAATNHCEPNQCENGATCQNNWDSFFCICPNGWTGHRCETSGK